MSLPMIAIRWDCSGKKGFTNDQFYLGLGTWRLDAFIWCLLIASRDVSRHLIDWRNLFVKRSFQPVSSRARCLCYNQPSVRRQCR